MLIFKGDKNSMHVIVVGINHKTAPVEIRERLTFNPSQLGDAMRSCKERKVSLKMSFFQPVIVRKYMRSWIRFILGVII